MINALMKLGIERMHLNIIKAIYDKLIASIILNWEKLKPFSLKSGMKQGCLVSLFLFNMVLEFQARAIGDEEEIKGIQTEKEEVKLSLFEDDMILYQRELPPKKKLLDIINTFRKVADTKSVYNDQ
jgi:hypothetical protein